MTHSTCSARRTDAGRPLAFSHWARLATTLVSLTGLASAPALAAESQPPATAARELLLLGDTVVRQGLSRQDPLLIAAGVRLLRASGIDESRARAKAAGSAAAEGRLPDETSLLETARTLAARKRDLRAVIEDLAVDRERGAQAGPQAARLLMRGHETQELLIDFETGRSALFGLATDKPDEVALEVIDGKGEPLCLPVPKGNELHCRWQVKDGTDARVRLTNRAARPQSLVFFHD